MLYVIRLVNESETEMQGKDGQLQTAFIFNFHQRLLDTLSVEKQFT